MKKTKYLFFAIILPLFGWTPFAHATTTGIIDITTGKLVGFNEVDINGDIWNVTFREGSFNTLFGSAANLDFTTSASAIDASTAIADVYGPLLTTWAGNPKNTHGISDANSGMLYIPFQVVGGLVTISAYNIPDGPGVIGPPFTVSTDFNTTSDTTAVYADWSKVVAAPVPAAVWLMGSGLLGLVGFSRKNKAQVADQT